jgi:hypothetical protein
MNFTVNNSEFAKDAQVSEKVTGQPFGWNNTGYVMNDTVTTGNVRNLCLIPEGSDYNERTGRSIKLKSIAIKAQLKVNATAELNTIRVMVVRTLLNSSSAPTVSDVLQSVDINSFRNRENNQRSFNVLYDRNITLSLDNDNEYKQFSFYKKLDSHMYFSGTAATEASSGKGAIYLMLLSDQSVNTPTMANCHTRITYVDN